MGHHNIKTPKERAMPKLYSADTTMTFQVNGDDVFNDFTDISFLQQRRQIINDYFVVTPNLSNTCGKRFLSTALLMGGAENLGEVGDEEVGLTEATPTPVGRPPSAVVLRVVTRELELWS